MAKKIIAVADCTPAQIEAWKKEHGKVWAYTTEDGKTGYFKRPSRSTVDASSALAQQHPIQSNELLAKDCFLGGDAEIISEDKYFYGLGVWLSGLIEKVQGELTEL
jgi:hypothetical protein